ncbi:MAG: HDOD domain-containing protein [Gammaproteobacteria bacterium]|nr:HDOD domain-containing protein [Gammaproteobacteria bacterium]
MLLNPSPSAPEISITRQAIYDENEGTFAYELQFRNSDAEFSSIDDSDPASSQIVANVFMEIGLKLLVADKPALINLPHAFLKQRHSIPFAKDKFILEISAGSGIDTDLLAALSDLRDQGFSIALQDLADDGTAAALVEHCELIKLDISTVSRDELARRVERLRPFGKLLLAHRVDSQEDFEFCKSLGLQYFQGSFLNQPKVVKYTTLPLNKTLLLQILAKTQDPNVEFGELEEIIGQDVGISFKFLRLINSANFGLSKKVESLHQALMLLGLQEIKSWVSLVALSNIDSVPQELTDMSLSRARFCKLLAEKAGCAHPDTYFTIGLFSLLDVIMSKSMKSILGSLPFADEINQALISHTGLMGEALDCAIAHEQGDWKMIKFAHLTPAEINAIYIDTLEWCRGIRSQLR